MRGVSGEKASRIMNALSTDAVSLARINIPRSEMLFSLGGMLNDLWKLVNKIPKGVLYGDVFERSAEAAARMPLEVGVDQ